MALHRTVRLHTPSLIHALKDDSSILKRLLKGYFKGVHHLVNKAKHQEIYAYTHLIHVRQQVDVYSERLTTLEKRAMKRMKQCEGHKYWQTYKPVVEDAISYQISHPLTHSFVNQLVRLDAYYQSLEMIRLCSGFHYQSTYARWKSEPFKGLLQTLRLTVDMAKLPETAVCLDDYLVNNSIYYDAIATFGDINPEILYAALLSTDTPVLDEKYMKSITEALQFKLKSLEGTTS